MVGLVGLETFPGDFTALSALLSCDIVLRGASCGGGGLGAVELLLLIMVAALFWWLRRELRGANAKNLDQL